MRSTDPSIAVILFSVVALTVPPIRVVRSGVVTAAGPSTDPSIGVVGSCEVPSAVPSTDPSIRVILFCVVPTTVAFIRVAPSNRPVLSHRVARSHRLMPTCRRIVFVVTDPEYHRPKGDMSGVITEEAHCPPPCWTVFTATVPEAFCCT